MSDLIAAFRIFATNQPVKSAGQVAEELRAAKMASEANAELRAMARAADRAARGLPAELTQAEKIIDSFTHIETEKDSQEVLALRDFYDNCDFNLLFPFLAAMRDWEQGQPDCAQHLQAIMSDFFTRKDNQLFEEQTPALLNIAVHTEDFAVLAKLIHEWMKNIVPDEVLQASINVIRQNNIDHHATYGVLLNIRNLLTEEEDVVDEQPAAEPLIAADAHQEPLPAKEPEMSTTHAKLVRVLTGLGMSERMSDYRPLPPPPPVRQNPQPTVVVVVEQAATSSDAASPEDIQAESNYNRHPNL
jgi:mannose-6-phosphate isomerase class I